MELTKIERQMLWNQFKILEKEDPKEKKEYIINQKILEKGFKEDYNLVFNNLSDEVPEEISQRVMHVLNMYLNLKTSFEKLEDKQDISSKDIEFKGFDGNDEYQHVAYVNFLLIDLNRYKPLQKEHSDYSNEVSTIRKYKRMLEKLEAVNEDYGELSADSIKYIIKA